MNCCNPSEGDAKRNEKDQRSRKHDLKKKSGRTRFKHIKGHCKEDRNNLYNTVCNRLLSVARKINIRCWEKLSVAEVAEETRMSCDLLKGKRQKSMRKDRFN